MTGGEPMAVLRTRRDTAVADRSAAERELRRILLAGGDTSTVRGFLDSCADDLAAAESAMNEAQSEAAAAVHCANIEAAQERAVELVEKANRHLAAILALLEPPEAPARHPA